MPGSETPKDAAERPPLSPLEGGRWRPVRPEELLVRRDGGDESKAAASPPRAPLERRQELERYLRDRPADIDAYLELAAIYREAGRSAEATRVLKQALETEPEHPQVLWQLEETSLARALQQLQDIRQIAHRLHTAEAQLELERAQVDWACRRADVCRARLARDPSLDHLRVVLAEALRDLGRTEEAIEALQPALHVDTEAPLAHLILGHCLQALGKDLEALAAWRAAALRRAVPAPARIRVVALRSAVDVAERLGLSGSLPLYRQALSQAQAEQMATSRAGTGNEAAPKGVPGEPAETTAAGLGGLRPTADSGGEPGNGRSSPASPTPQSASAAEQAAAANPGVSTPTEADGLLPPPASPNPSPRTDRP